MRGFGRRVAVALSAVGVAASGAGWYLAAHPGGRTHFESCQVLADGHVVVLAYAYGVGDTVTASARTDPDAVVVSLHVRGPDVARPAIAFSGELRYFVRGGLGGRPVRNEDGTTLTCVRGV